MKSKINKINDNIEQHKKDILKLIDDIEDGEQKTINLFYRIKQLEKRMKKIEYITGATVE